MRLPRDIGPVHFVGIGGIGMRNHRVLVDLGHTVQGSDQTDTWAARQRHIAIGHAARNLAGAQVVVISSAIEADDPDCRTRTAAVGGARRIVG